MARTRAEIKALVHMHTGRTKESLENSMCDTALKLAIQAHPFWDSISDEVDFALTEDATSVSIATASPEHVITARIVETDGTRNSKLTLKNRVWWDENVLNAEDNTKGWPEFAMHIGDNVYFDRPLESGLTLRVRVSTAKTFTDDTTVCPVACLDIFVEQFVTAMVFLSLENKESYTYWRIMAVGPRFDADKVGGTLLRAINSDKFGLGEEMMVERPGAYRGAQSGLSILNQITGHPRYGLVDAWF